jgi:hypothetical protein
MQKDIQNEYMRDVNDSLLFSVFYSYYCRFNKLTIREELCEALDNSVRTD